MPLIADTEGIVFRQTKAANGRRMILLFSRKLGKISVGTGITEGGKTKSALAIRPFTYGKYELYKGRDTYNMNSGQVIKSYYKIGENLDSYMAASYVLELTEKVLGDEISQPKLFNILIEFLEALEKRTRKQDTLVLAYMVKLLDVMGVMPDLQYCSSCGKEIKKQENGNMTLGFSIVEGSLICEKCAKSIERVHNEPLIYSINFGIVSIIRYFKEESFKTFEKIGLDDEQARLIRRILREYMRYHLDVGKLKSEDFDFKEV